MSRGGWESLRGDQREALIEVWGHTSYPITSKIKNLVKVPEYVSLFPDFSHGTKAEEGQFAYSKPFQVKNAQKTHR